VLLEGQALGQPGTGFPALVWKAPGTPDWVEAVIRRRGMEVLLADEGDGNPPCGPRRNEPPLWVLRRPNGKPNYANAGEMERYLKESGWLAWSAGGAGTKSNTSTPPEDAWEQWVIELGDPRRVPPADADVDLLHDLQLGARRRPTPTERLAEATVDEDGEVFELDADVDHDNEKGGDLIAA
jgi:hypothetical protein